MTIDIFNRFLFSIFFLILLLSYCNLVESKSLGIYTYKVLGALPWDADSINSGITGSEEAVIYISQKLADLGYQVLVFGDPPKNSKYIESAANPRYLPFNSVITEPLDVAISWRMPNMGKTLKAYAKKVYLWPHDTYSFPLSEEEINSFDDVLWLSEWQRKQWISVNPSFKKFVKIFGNGVNPEQFSPITERANSYSCIYGSNYARGLDILLAIWPQIKEKFPKATLDIYYGWQHWGLLSPEKEAAMKALVASLKPLDVTDHGLVSHDELNAAYAKASFWTYPCTALEVFCISALRAQLSGAIPIIIDGSALPETVPNGYKCQNSEQYLNTVIKAMNEAENITTDQRRKLADFILEKYTWEKIAAKWRDLFDSGESKAQTL